MDEDQSLLDLIARSESLISQQPHAVICSDPTDGHRSWVRGPYVDEHAALLATEEWAQELRENMDTDEQPYEFTTAPMFDPAGSPARVL